jgi:hypothetical protein
MANTKLCPKCSGKLIPVGERTGGFSAGKAVAGAVIAGPIGVAAGALGKKLVTLQCEKCGYTVETNEKDALAAEQYGDVYAPIAQIKQEILAKKAGQVRGKDAEPLTLGQLNELSEMERGNPRIGRYWSSSIKSGIGIQQIQELDPEYYSEFVGLGMAQMFERAYENLEFTGIATDSQKSLALDMLGLLSYEGKTATEINDELKIEFSALQMMNFMKLFGDAIWSHNSPRYSEKHNEFKQYFAYRYAGGPAVPTSEELNSICEEENKRLKEENERRAEQQRVEDGRKAEQSRQWAAQGRCRYCGGEIAGFFGKKCKSCGKKA